MARSILDIVVTLSKQGNADKQVITGLVQVKSAMMEAAAVAGTLVAAGYTIKKAFDETVGVAVEYADKVREITDVSRLSAEESSKLVQLTDDYKVSQEELLKIMQKNGDQYDYSIRGLAGMSDAYNDLSTKEEKANFMQERFGKNWGQFVELMEQGGRKIVAAGEDINGALILDEAALDSARQYEKTIDNIQDDLKATQVALGVGFLKAATEVQDASAITEEAQRRTNLSILDGLSLQEKQILLTEVEKIKVEQAYSARMNGLASLYATTEATKEKTAATEADVEALKAESDANTAFLGILGSVNSTYQSYMETTKNLEQERLDLEAEKQSLIAQGYSEQSTQIQDVNAKIAENTAKTTEEANRFEIDNKRIMLGYLERKLTADGILDDTELIWLTEKGVAWGVYHQTAVAETQAMIDEANALIDGMVTEKTFTLSLNAIYNTYGDNTRLAGSGQRYASGTNGWEKVPAGYPNDTYPIWLTSGESFAVVPSNGGGNGGGNVSMSNAGGGAVVVNVTINSMINTADRERIKSELSPVVIDAIRSARANGAL